jgi:hypothetical protein
VKFTGDGRFKVITMPHESNYIYLYTTKFSTLIKIRLNRKFESTEFETMRVNCSFNCKSVTLSRKGNLRVDIRHIYNLTPVESNSDESKFRLSRIKVLVPRCRKPYYLHSLSRIYLSKHVYYLGIHTNNIFPSGFQSYWKY